MAPHSGLTLWPWGMSSPKGPSPTAQPPGHGHLPMKPRQDHYSSSQCHVGNHGCQGWTMPMLPTALGHLHCVNGQSTHPKMHTPLKRFLTVPPQNRSLGLQGTHHALEEFLSAASHRQEGLCLSASPFSCERVTPPWLLWRQGLWALHTKPRTSGNIRREQGQSWRGEFHPNGQVLARRWAVLLAEVTDGGQDRQCQPGPGPPSPATRTPCPRREPWPPGQPGAQHPSFIRGCLQQGRCAQTWKTNMRHCPTAGEP